MKKLTKKLLSVILSVAVFTTLVSTSFAVSPLDTGTTLMSVSNDLDFDKKKAELDKMNDRELNAFISDVAREAQRSRAVNPLLLRLAWYAAALLAEPTYPCAAALVKSSALWLNYTETTKKPGLISTTIRNSSTYQRWAVTFSDPCITFETSDIPDLFFALHKADIVLVSHSARGGEIRVTDTFDFALMTDYDDVFVTVVNDWAWLSQQGNALKPISVTLTFMDGMIGMYSLKPEIM